jgi:sirohydrochlorin ferrochelatase
MTPGAAALVIPVVLFLGWHTARFLRAAKDFADAKAKVPQAKRVMGVERKAFAVVAGVVVVMVWWWLKRHGL